MVKPDIHTLAHHLKQERLYVASEKQLIQRLNGDVLKTAERLYRAAWIAKQQRINLDRLILTRWASPPLPLPEGDPFGLGESNRYRADAHFNRVISLLVAKVD